MSDTSSIAFQPPADPPVSAAQATINATQALVDRKADAVHAKATADGILAHIHDVAVHDLMQAKTFAQHIAPYAITAVASAAFGALAVFLSAHL